MSTGVQISQVYGSIDCVYTVYLYSILWCQHGQGYSQESFAKGSSFSGPWYSASHLPLTTLANRPRASRAAVSENVHVLAWDHGRPRSRDEGVDDLWKLSSERHTWTVDHERRRIDWCRLLSGPVKIVVHIGTFLVLEIAKAPSKGAFAKNYESHLGIRTSLPGFPPPLKVTWCHVKTCLFHHPIKHTNKDS